MGIVLRHSGGNRTVNLPVIVRQSIISGENGPTTDPWVNISHGISSVVVSSSLSVIS